jgi:hypothetical protein
MVWKLYFWNLRPISFLPVSYSFITGQSMKIKAGYSRCIIEKDVNVNIMRFRTLRSIEFQGLCSRNWNLPRSENYNFAIYCPYAFYQWLTRVSKDSPWRYKAGYSRWIIEKDVKVNICCFEPDVLSNVKASAAETEFTTVWKLYFWNLRSISFLPMTYSCFKRQSMKIYKAGYSRCINEKDVKVNIMRFRTLRSIEFQGLCSRNWNLPRSENCIFGIYCP